MEPHFRSIVAILFILSSALGAPTGDMRKDDSCIRLQNSSTKFNKIARLLSVQTSFGIANTTNVLSIIPWIEAKDKCDPGSLRNNPKPCILKISAALMSYRSEVDKVGKLQVCSKFSKQMKPVMDNFYTDMKNCVTATTELDLPALSTTTAHHSEDVDEWSESNLCHYIMERLFSFSILTARVFALGDPAGHSDSSAAPCM